MFRYLRVRPTKAICELRPKLRTVWVAHNRGRHRTGPAKIVAFLELQECFDLVSREPANVVMIVDIAWRWADKNQLLEAFRIFDRSHDSDHGRDRMADEYAIHDIELTANL